MPIHFREICLGRKQRRDIVNGNHKPKHATLGIGILASDFLKTEEVEDKSGRWVRTELPVAVGYEWDVQQHLQSDGLGWRSGSWGQTQTLQRWVVYT